MTELETVQRAKHYMDLLARGIDPISGKEIPDDSVLNQVRLARCFLYVSDVLGQVIANGRSVGAENKREFQLTESQMAGISASSEPVSISQLTQMLYAAAADPQMKKPAATRITNWLLEKGLLEKKTMANGKINRVPTRRGIQLGMFTQLRQGREGEYHAVFYNTDAQRFILGHLPDILYESDGTGGRV